MNDLVINIEATPNQEFTFDRGEDHWRISIKTANTSMICDLRLNGETLLLGSRIVNGRPIIPYKNLSANGNFAILTDDDEAPWWEKFGKSQFLVFYKEDVDD